MFSLLNSSHEFDFGEMTWVYPWSFRLHSAKPLHDKSDTTDICKVSSYICLIEVMKKEQDTFRLWFCLQDFNC
jgi:hypothetical protein